jgi:hypothetical protein
LIYKGTYTFFGLLESEDFKKGRVKKGIAGFIYKSLLSYDILGCGLRVEITYPR